MNLCEPRFDGKIVLSREKAKEDCQQGKEDSAESREVGLTGNRELVELPWNLLASLSDTTSTL